MPINSKAKGSAGERQWRDFLRKHGFTARRTQQYCGTEGHHDVTCEELDGCFHQEVKRVEKLNIDKAVEQSIRDCPEGKWRMVAHRKNRKPWLVTMPADDWIDLIKEWWELKNA